jgi:hypothetical protein
MPRPNFYDLAYLAGGALPPAALGQALSFGLADLGCALCLHRVQVRQPLLGWQEELNMPPSELDRLIELLLASRPGAATGWLTVSFDDGYADALEYIRTRAPRFPQVEFLFFVCPEKSERQVGFRWDLAELAIRGGTPTATASGLLDAPMSVDEENERADLKGLGGHPDFRLSTVEELRELARLPNVSLGNHTSLHAAGTRFAPEVVLEDYRRSTQAFERLFGQQAHFAFPYGTPGLFFTRQQVEALRALGPFIIWTTEDRPFRLSERRARAVLPRFPVQGTRSARELAGLIAGRALRFRLRGSRHDFA